MSLLTYLLTYLKHGNGGGEREKGEPKIWMLFVRIVAIRMQRHGCGRDDRVVIDSIGDRNTTSNNSKG